MFDIVLESVIIGILVIIIYLLRNIMSIIDNIKSLLPTKKPQIFEHVHTLDMEKGFYEHAGNIKECEYYYDSITASYYEHFKNSNRHTDVVLAGEPKREWTIYLPDYTAINVLKRIVDYTHYNDIDHTFTSIKSCLDIIMKKQEVEPWVIYNELAELKQYQYDFGGNPLPERREMLVNAMAYLKEHNFLPDPVKLREHLVSYYNNSGWDYPLADWETRENRQSGINNAIEECFKSIMEFDAPQNSQKNEVISKLTKIRQEVNSTNNTTDNKNAL